MRTVRRDPARPGMKSLTYYQANRTRVEVRTLRRDPAESGIEITHILSSQQDKSGSKDSEKEPSWT